MGGSVFGEGSPAAAIEFTDAGLSTILRNPEMNLGKPMSMEAETPHRLGFHSVLHVLRVNFENTDSQSLVHTFSPLPHSFARGIHRLPADATSPTTRFGRNIVPHLSGSRHALLRAYFRTRTQIWRLMCQAPSHASCASDRGWVLDIGCGWGSLALYLAEHHQVHVTGLTLSVEQLKVANAQ